jgi:hypothetical protein
MSFGCGSGMRKSRTLLHPFSRHLCVMSSDSQGGVRMSLVTLRGWLLFAFIWGLVTTLAYADPMGTLSLTGEWGGEHIRLVVKETSAKAEFDCAFGEINEPIHPDRDGNFEVRGVYMFERGGPVSRGQPPLRRHPAVYRGWTNGKEMRLTVTLLDTAREVGPFSLGLGRRAFLDKCL